MQIPLDKILPNPEQPRELFDEEDLESLAQSIRENGVIQPVVVEAVPEKNGPQAPALTGDSPTYILHDGERRCRAARLAGLTEIPAAIVPGLNGDGQEKRLLRAMIANVQRKDLSHIEEARGYQRLQDMGLTVADISRRTGKAATQVYQKLDLLKLEPEVQELIHRRKLSATRELVVALRRIPDSRQRVELATRAAERRFSAVTIIRAAHVLIAEAEGRQAVAETPSLGLAIHRSGRPDLPRWDALAQLGRVPPWSVVEQAARDTCAACVLRLEASKTVCGQCPAVVLLEETIKKVSR